MFNISHYLKLFHPPPSGGRGVKKNPGLQAGIVFFVLLSML
jgi:hypothetical protein